MKFTVEVRDYERGDERRDITADRIERAIRAMLDQDSSDGIVIVTKVPDADQG